MSWDQMFPVLRVSGVLRKIPWTIAPVRQCPGHKHSDISAAKMEEYSHTEGSAKTKKSLA